MRCQVTFDVQDITAANMPYLCEKADSVCIGEVTEIQQTYDIIFSTFVWEHLSRPDEVYQHLLGMLAAGGALFLAAPRYDLPFYIPASAKHLPKRERLQIGVYLLYRRCLAIVRKQPEFLIHLDPACLSHPWFRDADAIHWVSYLDLLYALPSPFTVQRLRLPCTGIKGRVWESFCLLFVKIQRTEEYH
jgi:hypothetical protein